MTFSSCDCSIDWYDGPSVCQKTMRRARKPHVCCECGRTIEPGMRYEHVRGLWDGYWQTYRTCRTCRTLRHLHCPRGWIYGELRETLRECLGSDPYEGILP